MSDEAEVAPSRPSERQDGGDPDSEGPVLSSGPLVLLDHTLLTVVGVPVLGGWRLSTGPGP